MLKLQYKDNPARGIWLVGESATLGSDPSNTLVLSGSGAESFHAAIVIKVDGLLLKSEADTCYVNNMPVDTEYQLQENDELRIGENILVLIDSQQLNNDTSEPSNSAIKKPLQKSGWSLEPKHPKLQHKDFSVTKTISVGRAKECGFAIPYKLLSREHARLTIEAGQLVLEDLNSANGSFVNGKRVRQAHLKDGDIVAFAKMEFKVKGPRNLAAPPEKKSHTVIRSISDINPEIDALNAANEAVNMQEQKPGPALIKNPIGAAGKTTQMKSISPEADRGIDRIVLVILAVLALSAAVVTRMLGLW